MKVFELKMDVGPDGSLCRITSSAKVIVNNIKIVKLSGEELFNPDEPQYKLVFTGEEENDSESLSEKSDEEVMDEKLDIKLSNEIIVKDKDAKVQEAVEETKPQNEKFAKKSFNNRFRSKSKQHRHRNSKFSGTRNFNSASNVTKTYNRLVANTTSQDIEPWLNPPPILNPHQFEFYPQYPPVVKPSLNNSVQSDMSVGLLGDSPYSPHFPQHNFQSSNQSNHFGHGQNFWNDEYSSSYSPSVQNRQISHRSGNNKYYRNKRWNNKGRPKSWERNQKDSQQERRKDKGHYDYRN